MIDENVKTGTIVVASYGYNAVLDKSFKFLYEFGYYTQFGCVVYNKGERNMQDSHAFTLNQITIADEVDLRELSWGS